jgi:light-regulated signal transduction histidine kinase (bacteriophytochrome)
MQQLVNAIPNLLYVKNARNEFITVNNAFAAFLGTTADDLLQYPHGQQQSYSAVLNKITARDSEVFFKKDIIFSEEEEIFDVHSGKLIWLKTIKVPLMDHQGVFSEILSVSMDVSALKLKENEVTHLNDQLEIKVAERTNALEIANKELETFNYSVSHDLRTPLRSIDIFAYFLDKQYHDTLDADGRENIRQIRSSVVKMSNLIDNLLIFSKMGRSDKRMDPVPTKALIEEVLGELNKHADLSHYTILMRELPVLTGDYAMLRQAMMNLISNAVKYSKTRKRPVLEFFSEQDEQNHTIGIRDNGVGFSPELKNKLFQAFRRLHSDEQFDGTGVGLAIVERIIKRHNGMVWAESTEGIGTTFYFSIPR